MLRCRTLTLAFFSLGGYTRSVLGAARSVALSSDMFSDDANDVASVDVWELLPDGLRWPLASVGPDGMLPCPGAVLRRGMVLSPVLSCETTTMDVPGALCRCDWHLPHTSRTGQLHCKREWRMQVPADVCQAVFTSEHLFLYLELVTCLHTCALLPFLFQHASVCGNIFANKFYMVDTVRARNTH